ncbi:MAG TPA: hypothetical protein VI455_02190 [Terriglobia bacterium]
MESSSTAVSPDREISGVVEPAGYRILVRIPELKAQMERWANLYMPDQTRSLEEAAQIVGQVVGLGPDAYQDQVKFPSGPWCAPGDFVLFRAFAGTRFLMHDRETGEHTEYRLINDDTVQAVVRGDARVERI